MAKRARFAINVDSGVVVYRSDSTDALPTLWKLIDDETASAIVKKKVGAGAVIEAIQKSIVRADGFNWKEYDAKRREELKLYNVSQRDMVPDGGLPDDAKKEEREDKDVLSLSELGFADKPADKPADKGKLGNKGAVDGGKDKPADKGKVNGVSY